MTITGGILYLKVGEKLGRKFRKSKTSSKLKWRSTRTWGQKRRRERTVEKSHTGVGTNKRNRKHKGRSLWGKRNNNKHKIEKEKILGGWLKITFSFYLLTQMSLRSGG